MLDRYISYEVKIRTAYLEEKLLGRGRVEMRDEAGFRRWKYKRLDGAQAVII